ncbi:MAG: glycosyltransferase family 39 protein [Pyrinomonadaceae bacterium]
MSDNHLTKAGEKSLTNYFTSDVGLLVFLALFNILLHAIFNNNYGFHRDELATIDDARYLAWGYVAYPPVTPFIARLAFALFGDSLVGLRFFGALAIGIAMVLSGLMARALGGSRFAQLLAALGVAVAPICIIQGSLFQYVSFDYLCWVCIAFLMIKLLQTDNPRWWLGIGAFIGIGMLTKYTVALFVIGIVVGVLATRARRYLKSPWLWAGVAVSLIIWLPNIVWQIQHQFISIDFMRSIHERDVAIGRTQNFIAEQFFICTNFVTVPLWLAGLWFYAKHPLGARFRAVFWMFVIPLILFIFLQGRSYYFAPAYPMLFAAGGILCERGINSRSLNFARLIRAGIIIILLGGGAIFSLVLMPIAPVNSALWRKSAAMQDNFVEEIGWRELTETVAAIYNNLPDDEKSQAGILAGNYGEAGAINLYGTDYGLPKVISTTNSYWLRGYGEPAPQTLIVVGYSQAKVGELFESCRLAGQITNQYAVENEETRVHKNIFVCRGLRESWEEFWKIHRSFS